MQNCVFRMYLQVLKTCTKGVRTNHRKGLNKSQERILMLYFNLNVGHTCVLSFLNVMLLFALLYSTPKPRFSEINLMGI